MPKIMHCPNHPGHPDHRAFVTTVTEQHSWIVTDRGECIRDLGCDQLLQGPDSGNAWVCHSCGAEAVEAKAMNVTFYQGQATLEDGTQVNLLEIQEYLAGCYSTTGYAPYAEMADKLALLTSVNWRAQ